VSAQKHIFVVEDNGMLREMISTFLLKEGYVVSVFPDGEKALEAVRSTISKIALVLTDFSMPGITGGELAQALRQLDPNCPVVLLSGEYSEKTLPQELVEYFDKIIHKPFEMDFLIDELCRIVR